MSEYSHNRSDITATKTLDSESSTQSKGGKTLAQGKILFRFELLQHYKRRQKQATWTLEMSFKLAQWMGHTKSPSTIWARSQLTKLSRPKFIDHLQLPACKHKENVFIEQSNVRALLGHQTRWDKSCLFACFYTSKLITKWSIGERIPIESLQNLSLALYYSCW